MIHAQKAKSVLSLTRILAIALFSTFSQASICQQYVKYLSHDDTCQFVASATEITIDLVAVGNSGNTANFTGYGAVGYDYFIGKYEVTAGQYTKFLNDVAATDTYGLYNESMWSSSHGCKIQRAGSPGNYTYSVAEDWANRPVNYISWGDAARFVNWLYNHQPIGSQNLATTEDGSYYLNGAMTTAELLAVTRKPDATWVIPNRNEWYKAAFHKNDGVTGNYFLYTTASDSYPSNSLTAPDPGNNATFYDNGYTIGLPYLRTVVGAHENSESPYYAFDMGGNIEEWNDTIVNGSYRRISGGSYSTTRETLCSAVMGGIYDPHSESSGVGFRIVFLPIIPKTITVCYDGSADFTNIQDAIDYSRNGDEIVVCDGTYTGAKNRDLDFGGRAITLRSENGSDSCSIDCQNSGRGFYFHNSETDSSVLDGFTIKNGNGTDGGGIFCKGSSPTITNCAITQNTELGSGICCDMGANPEISYCTITDNEGSSEGGGIACLGESNPKITNCIITGNTVEGVGGGICCSGSSPDIENCTITGNQADSYGGGISCSSDSAPHILNTFISDNAAGTVGGGIACVDICGPEITNCLISENVAAFDGGGMYNSGSNPTLLNCTVYGNFAPFSGGGIYNDSSNPTVTNSILWNNGNEISGTATVSYSCIQNGFAGTNNTDQDPLFAAAGEGNLRLSVGSPCIDTGNNTAIPPEITIDIDGKPRIIDGNCDSTGTADMGAYEFGWVYIGDFAGGCDIDFADFAVFALAWLTEDGDLNYNSLCDISVPADSTIDEIDLSIFVDNWLEGK